MTVGTTITMPGQLAPARANGAMWWLVAAGLLVLYLPTYRDLDAVYWARENGAPGIVVVAIWLWLVWRARAVLHAERRTLVGSVVGWMRNRRRCRAVRARTFAADVPARGRLAASHRARHRACAVWDRPAPADSGSFGRFWRSRCRCRAR